jgi:S-(hydroxymethyl)glutathione dehydrogenase / alcohol dehydrogenase
MKISKAKAAILVESRKPLVVDEIELPDALGVGQVLVKVLHSTICGAQINEIEAVKGPDKFLPHLLGHEASATVVDVGPGVVQVKPHDTVVLHWRPSLGIQSRTPAYRWRGAPLNAGWVTTFNEYAVVAENRMTVIPSDLDLKIAPLFGCAVTTAAGVINNDAKVKIGESVAIFGVGGVGQSDCRGRYRRRKARNGEGTRRNPLHRRVAGHRAWGRDPQHRRHPWARQGP